MAKTSRELFRSVLLQSLILVGAIALLGGALAFLLVGMSGLVSALIGAAIALAFTGFTVGSVWIGSRLPLGGFYGLVLGGWLLKIILFAILLALLQGAAIIHGPTLFFAIVASVLGALAIDSFAVLKARIPTLGEQS